MVKNPESFHLGFCLKRFPLSNHEWSAIREKVLEENWEWIDTEFKRLTRSDGAIFQFLQQYVSFSSIETMISIRDSSNSWEEDGVWHDDGSRVFAFSLSLTPDASQVDGILEIRKKGEAHPRSLSTPEFGTAILFLTGVHGFEHRTRAVTRGRRIILVGWLNQ